MSATNSNNPIRPPSQIPNSQCGIMSMAIKFAIFLARIVIVYETIMCLCSIFNYKNHYSYYRKALLANGITYALRLHQIKLNEGITRQTLNSFIIEDSAHYLIYSIIFLFSMQFTLVLFPIFFFTLLHLNSVLKSVSSGEFKNFLVRQSNNYEKPILRAIALAEIILMPLSVVAATINFSLLQIFIPFAYYRFILLRYTSRRNPYNRMMFSELKNTILNSVSYRECPNFVRLAAYKSINFISRLAPVVNYPS